MRSKSLLAAATLAALLSSPVSATADDDAVTQLRQEIDRLRSDYEQRIAALEARLAGTGRVARSTGPAAAVIPAPGPSGQVAAAPRRYLPRPLPPRLRRSPSSPAAAGRTFSTCRSTVSSPPAPRPRPMSRPSSREVTTRRSAASPSRTSRSSSRARSIPTSAARRTSSCRSRPRARRSSSWRRSTPPRPRCPHGLQVKAGSSSPSSGGSIRAIRTPGTSSTSPWSTAGSSAATDCARWARGSRGSCRPTSTPRPSSASRTARARRSPASAASPARAVRPGDRRPRGRRRSRDLLLAPRYAASFDLTDTQTLLVGASAAFGPNGTGAYGRDPRLRRRRLLEVEVADGLQGLPVRQGPGRGDVPRSRGRRRARGRPGRRRLRRLGRLPAAQLGLPARLGRRAADRPGRRRHGRPGDPALASRLRLSPVGPGSRPNTRSSACNTTSTTATPSARRARSGCSSSSCSAPTPRTSSRH